MEKCLNEGVCKGKAVDGSKHERGLMPDVQQNREQYISFIEAG